MPAKLDPAKLIDKVCEKVAHLQSSGFTGTVEVQFMDGNVVLFRKQKSVDLGKLEVVLRSKIREHFFGAVTLTIKRGSISEVTEEQTIKPEALNA